MGAKGGKTEEGGSMLIKTPIVVTPALSNGGGMEEVGSSMVGERINMVDVEEEGA